MPAPTATDVAEYLGTDSSWEEDSIESAFNAEKAAQARVCRVPLDTEVWPDDLVEALFRRVQHNLALRNLPLGVQTSMSEGGVATSRVGGTDAEVRRLEAPHRKVTVG
jgi:hypothetical protein